MWPVYVPPVPEPPDRSQELDRHVGMWCGCLLLDCCHSEIVGTIWNHGSAGPCCDSGTPASGYLYPWEPGDDSWRNALSLAQFGAVAIREKSGTGG